jgi:RNA polymerase-associated protein LEO1
MANEDLIKDVFGGSDSDSDSEGGDAGTKADAPKRGAALEDSDDDAPAEAKGEDGAPDAQPKFRSSLEDPEQADGDSDDDEDERANVPAAAPPMTIEKALHDPLVSTTIPKLVKLTNIAGVESRPFDASSFEPTEDHHLKNHNVMRWRRNKDTGKIESNARFVKWSDGTTQLVIGDETLAVSEATVNKDHAYVFARHAGAMQARAHVHSKLVFRPATLDSETHRRLTRAVDKKHVKSAQTRMHIEVQDPEAAKDAADREALRLEKDAELLRKKRAAAMRGGGYGGGTRDGPSARVEAGYAEYFDRGAGLDGDFLEADDDDDDDDDVETREAEKAAAELKRSAPGGYDDEAAFEEEDAAPAAKKRRGRALESDSEE